MLLHFLVHSFIFSFFILFYILSFYISFFFLIFSSASFSSSLIFIFQKNIYPLHFILFNFISFKLISSFFFFTFSFHFIFNKKTKAKQKQSKKIILFITKITTQFHFNSFHITSPSSTSSFSSSTSWASLNIYIISKLIFIAMFIKGLNKMKIFFFIKLFQIINYHLKYIKE